MVPLLFISVGLRSEGDNEKKRKRVKRNEIQYMIKVNHWHLFKLCFKNVLFMNRKKFMITMLANLELNF